VANSLAENYVEQNCKLVDGNAKGCGLAFAATLGVKARLEKSEEHLQDYARRNDLVFLEIGQGTKPERSERAGPAIARKS